MEKTIRELCKRVAATGGLDADIESVTVYQDLIGHASVQENSELANTPELMESFYRIYGVAYGTVEAIRYYYMHSDKLIDLRYEAGENQAKLEIKEKELEEAQKKIAEVEGRVKECRRDMDGTLKELDSLKGTIAERDAEIMQLKAKLYDLEHKEA